MKDIIFINPLNHSKTKINAVALQIIKSVCSKNGYRVEIIDLQVNFIDEKISFNQDVFSWIMKQLENKGSRMYGITTMNASFYWSKVILNILKKLYPEAILFMGGPHVTGLKQEIFQEINNVDYLLLYEGEETILNFLQYIDNEKSILPINVIKRGIKKYKAELTCIDINMNPPLEYEEYLKLNIIDVEVGRACPFNCYYCSSRNLLGNNVRYKNVEKILKESQCVFNSMNSDSKVCINFTHDNFLSHRRIFMEFVEKKLQGHYDFNYGCGGRIDLIDDEVVELLVKSDCKYIFVGIETGSAKMQKICRKGLDLSTIERKIKLLTQNSIYVEANFIIGFPEETLDDLYDTLKFISKLSWISPLVNVGFSYMSPEPCTDIYDKALDSDYVIVTNSQYYKELSEVGLTPETLKPKFYNHLYTIKNENYEIIKYVETGWKYLELLRRYYVSSQLLFNIHKIDLVDAFEKLSEMQDEDELINYYLLQNREYLTELERNMIKYEMDRNRIKKGLVNERFENARFVYNFPVQKIYKNFLIDSESYQTWKNIKHEKLEVIKNNVKKYK